MVISSIADRKFLLSKLWNRRSNHCSHNSIAVNKCIGRALPLEPRISNAHESYITSIYIFISVNADKFYVFFFSIKINGFYRLHGFFRLLKVSTTLKIYTANIQQRYSSKCCRQLLTNLWNQSVFEEITGDVCRTFQTSMIELFNANS